MNIGQEKRKLAEASPGELVSWNAKAWKFCLSFDPDGLWAFSASLLDRSRSTPTDWAFLGRMVGMVGGPKGPALGDSVRHSPGAVHKWLWASPDSPHGKIWLDGGLGELQDGQVVLKEEPSRGAFEESSASGLDLVWGGSAPSELSPKENAVILGVAIHAQALDEKIPGVKMIPGLEIGFKLSGGREVHLKWKEGSN